jgi:hypothetical protein
MTDRIEQALRDHFAEDAAHAPGPGGLAMAARRQAASERRRHVGVLGAFVTAAALVGGVTATVASQRSPEPGTAQAQTNRAPGFDQPRSGSQGFSLSAPPLAPLITSKAPSSLFALMTGVEIIVTSEGCVQAAPRLPDGVTADREHAIALIWPPGSRTRRGADGRAEILDADGKVIIREGELLSVGGGNMPGRGLPCEKGAESTWSMGAKPARSS